MRKRVIWFAVLGGAILAWTLMLYLFGTQWIVERSGNAYLALFLIAAVGGMSTFTAATYFSTLFALTAAGLNPFLLGLLGGLGITIGDSLFFLFGRHGRAAVPERAKRIMDKARKQLERFHHNTVPLFIFLYAGFTPFPNEFATITVGLAGAKYKQIIIPLLAGNILITTLACLGVRYVTGLA